MLSAALKEHNLKNSTFKESQEERKRVALASISNFSNHLVDALNTDVEQAYNNQKKIENEAKKLQNHVELFSKQTQLWINMLENFNQALKELGDVDNWARTIEADITTIASALEYAYKGPGPRSQVP
uniref:Biogenesis of lysosome-related organelles complex 1 subunit 1 n=1 Tax=Hydra vulgaris TaxID=6087 RepID=T2MDX9_HYDVU